MFWLEFKSKLCFWGTFSWVGLKGHCFVGQGILGKPFRENGFPRTVPLLSVELKGNQAA